MFVIQRCSSTQAGKPGDLRRFFGRFSRSLGPRSRACSSRGNLGNPCGATPLRLTSAGVALGVGHLAGTETRHVSFKACYLRTRCPTTHDPLSQPHISSHPSHRSGKRECDWGSLTSCSTRNTSFRGKRTSGNSVRLVLPCPLPSVLKMQPRSSARRSGPSPCCLEIAQHVSRARRDFPGTRIVSSYVIVDTLFSFPRDSDNLFASVPD